MRAGIRVAAAAIAAALAIAGCGGGGSDTLSSQDYSKQLKSFVVPLGKSLQNLQVQANSATTRKQLTSALGAADNAVQKASDGIDALDPPNDASDANAALVTALDTYEKSIADTEETVRSGSKSEIKAQVASFKTDTKTFVASVNKVKGQLKSAGIKVGGGQ
jgi:hypothetical protein